MKFAGIEVGGDTMIEVNGTPLSKMDEAEPPPFVKGAFEAVRAKKGLDHVTLRYILAIVVKSYCSELAFIGEFGCADYDTNTCYVVESDFGEEVSMMVALHELRHFYDGPHPWPEERGVREYKW